MRYFYHPEEYRAAIEYVAARNSRFKNTDEAEECLHSLLGEAVITFNEDPEVTSIATGGFEVYRDYVSDTQTFLAIRTHMVFGLFASAVEWGS